MKLKKLSIAVLLLSSATYLSACGPLLIGGAAAGTTYVAKDERSVGTIVDDATITTQIKAKFVNEPLLSALNIHVDTEKGVVTLSGNAKSHEASRRAVVIAKNTKGVVKIINKITVVR